MHRSADMKRTLIPRDILVYYDGPELFVGIDQVGARYICLLAESNDTLERYLCAPISAERLSNFIIGKVDLLDIFKEPEIDEIYTVVVEDSSVTEVSMQPISFSDLHADWLPEKGFFFEQEAMPTDLVVQEACYRNKGIVHLALNPPEARGEETKINSITLADTVKQFQTLVKFAYKRALSSLKANLRKKYEAAENYELEVFSFSPGSFKLHMQTKVSGDFAVYTELFRAMGKIDELMQAVEDPEHALEILKQNKGHLIGSFRKFLALIIEKDIPLYYEWTTPSQCKPVKKSISRETAQPIYELLLATQELDKEQKEFFGTFTMTNVEAGLWTILNEEDNKHYSGRIDEETPVNLIGISMGDTRYRIICEERIEEETVSGKEKTHYFLISYEQK